MSSIRRLVLAVVALLIAISLGEVALWALGLPRTIDEFQFLGGELGVPDTFVPDDRLFWRLDPATPHYRANAAGFRGDWPEERGSADEYRIVCIGDSCTFGASVALEATYGVVLERLLQERWQDRPVRATLLGLPGHSTHQNRLAFEDHGGVLAPDLTVLYVGVWNDYCPAVDCSDAQQSERLRSWRIGRLIAASFAPDLADRQQERRQQMQDGVEPELVRVSLDEFVRNVRAMVERARALGSEVIVVLPGLPAVTLAKFPVAARYHAALRALTQELGVRVVDAAQVFDRFEAEVPRAWRDAKSSEVGPLFLDWVHPSALGYGLMARAIAEQVPDGDAGGERSRPTAALARPNARVELTPSSAAALPGPLRIRVRSGAGISTPLRVWIGDRLLLPAVVAPGLGDAVAPRLHREGERAAGLRDDGEFVARSVVAPGRHRVWVVDADGVFEPAAPFVVTPPSLRATVEPLPDRDGARQVRVRFSIDALPEGAVALWLSTSALAEPIPTQCGEFGLTTLGSGRPAGMPEVPFDFERLGQPGLAGRATADGRCELMTELALPAAEPRPVGWAQGLVFDDNEIFGALSDVVRVELSRDE